MASLAEFVGLAFYMGPAGTRARRLKAKEFMYLLGLKPKPKTFGFVIEAHDLPREGRIEVARWLHPGAYPIAPLQVQAAVDQLRRFLRPGDVAIDIGAHTGDTTIPIALAVGATGRVLGLEPNPYVFPVLERNASLNPAKTSILPLNFAAMRTDGLYDFLVHHGYAVHRVEGNADYLGDRITPENLMRWNVYDVFCIPSS